MLLKFFNIEILEQLAGLPISSPRFTLKLMIFSQKSATGLFSNELLFMLMCHRKMLPIIAKVMSSKGQRSN